MENNVWKWRLIKLGIAFGAVLLLALGCEVYANANVTDENALSRSAETKTMAVPGEQFALWSDVRKSELAEGLNLGAGANNPFDVRLSNGAHFVTSSLDSASCPIIGAQRVRCNGNYRNRFFAQIDDPLAPGINQVVVTFDLYEKQNICTDPFQPGVGCQSYVESFGFVNTFGQFVLKINRLNMVVYKNSTARIINLDDEVSLLPGNNVFTVFNHSADIVTTPLTLDDVSVSGGDGVIILASNISTRTLNRDEATTFGLNCNNTDGGFHTAQVSIGNNTTHVNPYAFTVTCGSRPDIVVTYEATEVVIGSTINIVQGANFFRISYIANGGTLTVSNPVLTGSPAIWLSSGVTATEIAPNQQSEFILTCSPNAPGEYRSAVSIANSINAKNPYSYEVLCIVTEVDSNEGGFSPAGNQGDGGGTDVTNPENIPIDPIGGGDDSGGDTGGVSTLDTD